MKIIAIKLFIIVCCGSYNNEHYHYEAKSVDDSSLVYSVYSTSKYNFGDTIQYRIMDWQK
jgi:hypothetical protein